MLDALELLDTGPAHHAADLVPLLEQQLGEIRPVLPGHARDQRPLRVAHPYSLTTARSWVLGRSAHTAVAIFEPHDVVQFRCGDLEHVGVLESFHAVAQPRRDVRSIAGLEHLGLALAMLRSRFEMHATREDADRLVLTSMVLKAQRLALTNMENLAHVAVRAGPD